MINRVPEKKKYIYMYIFGKKNLVRIVRPIYIFLVLFSIFIVFSSLTS